LGIEELDGTTLRHREAPFPKCPAAGRHGATAWPDIHTNGKLERRRFAAVISAGPPEGGGTSVPRRVDINKSALERGGPPQRSLFAGQPVQSRRPIADREDRG